MFAPALHLTFSLCAVAATVALLLALRPLPIGRKEEQKDRGVGRETEGFGKKSAGREKVGHPVQG